MNRSDLPFPDQTHDEFWNPNLRHERLDRWQIAREAAAYRRHQTFITWTDYGSTTLTTRITKYDIRAFIPNPYHPARYLHIDPDS